MGFKKEDFLVRITTDEFKEWNERMVKKYDPDAFHHHSNPLIRFVEHRRVNAIVKLMDIHEEAFVLEIGCGAGNVIKKIHSGKLFGMDISRSILNKAKLKLNKKVHLFQGDALNLPCKGKVFTQVVCSEVLEHLLSPSEAVYEMARILESRGVAIISVPNEVWINRMKSVLLQLGLFKWFVHRGSEYKEMPERMEDEWHLHALPLEQWVSLFKQCFKVTHLKRIPFLWLPLRYVIHLEKLK
jgi:ubiquinone/menaquinone biosynthesis C-methylase UbiE